MDYSTHNYEPHAGRPKKYFAPAATAWVWQWTSDEGPVIARTITKIWMKSTER